MKCLPLTCVALCAALPAFAFDPSPLSAPESYSVEGGVRVEANVDSASTELDFSPVFDFSFSRVESRGRPAEVAAFLDRSGSVSTAFQIFAGLKQRNPDGSSDLDNTTVGYDVAIRYVWDVLPITLSVPLAEKRIRWKYADDFTAALLHYHTMGLMAGYYLLPNVELSAGMGYLQPDLFYKTDPDGTVYNYLAWDIAMYSAELRCAFEPAGGQWIFLEPSFTLLKDAEENYVSGVSVKASYFPTPALGVEASYSSSTSIEGQTYNNILFQAIGVTEAGLAVSVDLFALARLRVYASMRFPEDDAYESVTVYGAQLFLRL